MKMNKLPKRRLSVALASVMAVSMLLNILLTGVTAGGDLGESLIAGVKGQGIEASAAHISSYRNVTFSSEAQGNTLDQLTDGNTVSHIDFWTSAPTQVPGVKYDLGGLYDLNYVRAYVGIHDDPAHAVTGLSVYGSDTDEGIISDENLLYSCAAGDTANEKGGEVSPDRAVRYVIFLMTEAPSDFRAMEFQLYGDPAEPAESLIAGKAGQGIRANGMDLTAVTETTFGSLSEQQLTGLTDGDATVHYDVWGGCNDGDARGFLYDLGNFYTIDSVKAFVGIDGYPVTGVRVYAGKELDTLYTADNIVYDSVDSPSGSALEQGGKLAEKKDARHVAFLVTAASGGDYRFKEFEVFGQLNEDIEPAGSNIVFGKYGQGVYAVGGDYTKVADVSFGSEAQGQTLDKLTDGDLANHIDLYGAGTNLPDVPGVSYDLGGVYTLSNLAVYMPQIPDHEITGLRVYASNEKDTLYESGSLVYQSEDGVTPGEITKISVTSNVNARYVTFFFTSTAEGWRVRELQVYGVKYVSDESILSGLAGQGIKTNGSAFEGFADITYGSITDEERTAFTDGDTVTHKDLWGSTGDLDYRGMRYDLNAIYSIEKVKIFAGIEGYPITGARVYAAQTLEELYNVQSVIYDSTGKPEGAQLEQTGKVNSVEARYVAFVLTAAGGGDYRVREFQAFGSFVKNVDEPDEPVEPDPELPNADTSVIKGMTASAYRAMLGNFGNISATQFSSVAQGHTLDKLTDCDLTNHIDVYGGMQDNEEGKDFPGFVYDLRGEFDISTMAAHVMADDGIAIKGVRMYASDDFDSLFDASNVVYDSSEIKGIHALKLDSSRRARYVAFFLNDTQGGWRVRELQVFGTPVGDHEEPVDPTPLPSGDSVIAGFKGQGVRAVYGDFSRVESGKFGSESKVENGEYPYSLQKLTDGDTLNHIDIWGNMHDDADGKDLPGVMYDLKGIYDITDLAAFVCDTNGIAITGVRMYASERYEDLYKDASLYYNRTEKVTPIAAHTIHFDSPRRVRYVAFFFTSSQDGGWRPRELQVFGTKFADAPPDPDAPKEQDPPPEVSGPSLIAGKMGSGLRVVAKSFTGASPITFGSEAQGNTLDKLTDGDRETHIDFWGGLNDYDQRGVLYDLGAFYDVSQLRMYLVAQRNTAVTGVRMYASDSMRTLYQKSSLLYNSEGNTDLLELQYVALSQTKRVRYVAFFLSETDLPLGASGWRAKEFEVYGTKSKDQTPPPEPDPDDNKSLIYGLTPLVYGVDSTADLSDTVFAGASSADPSALTNGVIAEKDPLNEYEMWGGKEPGVRFVITYDLEKNFDLTEAAVYLKKFETILGLDENPKDKEVRKWDFYASRYLADLHKEENKVVGKTDYADDDDTAGELRVKPTTKMARYVSFVFTVEDRKYGALRLNELEVFGNLSAEQDVEPEPEPPREYVDVTDSATGILVRVFMKDELDEFPANPTLSVTVGADKTVKNTAFAGLDRRYHVGDIYKLELKDASGSALSLDGRTAKVYFPSPDGNTDNMLALIDDDNAAELVNCTVVNGKFVFDAYHLWSYAVLQTGAAVAGAVSGLLVAQILLWVVFGLAAAGLAFLFIMGRKNKADE